VSARHTKMKNVQKRATLTESRDQMHVGFDRVRVEIGKHFARHDILDSDVSEPTPHE